MLYHMAYHIVYHMVDHLVFYTEYHMVYHTEYHMGYPIVYHIVYQMVDHMVHQMVHRIAYQLAGNLGAQPSKVQGHLQGRAVCTDGFHRTCTGMCDTIYGAIRGSATAADPFSFQLLRNILE